MSFEFTSYSGAKVKINDQSLIGITLAVEAQFKNESIARHEKAMQDGIVAYRPIDGWVDTEKCIATFFRNMKEKGWYWGNNLDIKEGDKIGLNLDEEVGYVAIVDKITSDCKWCVDCHYTNIEKIKN